MRAEEFIVEKKKRTLRNTNPCWKGYKPVGTKEKNGKTVPNCVPEGVENVEEDWKDAVKKGIAGVATAATLGMSTPDVSSMPAQEPTAMVQQQQEEDPLKKELGDVDALKSMIKSHEGLRLKPYKDTRGLPTVGYGHLIKKGEDYSKGLTQQQADELFDRDFEHHLAQARSTPGWDKASHAQRHAMVDLAYNMGGAWHKKWPKFSAAAQAGDWDKAARELEKSRWYKQVKTRAPKVVDLFRRTS